MKQRSLVGISFFPLMWTCQKIKIKEEDLSGRHCNTRKIEFYIEREDYETYNSAHDTSNLQKKIKH
jgi:hypothetical protein